MKIVIAFDSFKGCISSADAGQACAEGLRRALPGAEIRIVSVGDGGEGTLDALAASTGYCWHTAQVRGPLGEEVAARFAASGDGRTVLTELAEASGLTLVPAGLRDPMTASTYGCGELLKAIIDTGCRRIYIGLGGSATVDGGMGLLAALGARFTDSEGQQLKACGEALERVARADMSGLDWRLRETRIRALCDVDNPLLGPEGAAHTFAPQKGATPEQTERLARGLAIYARALSEATGTDMSALPGTGAAGGAAAALASIGARLCQGIEETLDILRFDKLLRGADLVITGEGRMDSQTLHGKTAAGILRHASRRGIPVAALAGQISDREQLREAGFAYLEAITPEGQPLDEAMLAATARRNLALAAERLGRRLSVKP